MAPERQRRRKVTLACEPCRHRKARCDGGKPICSTCRQRSLSLEECIYNTANARTACTDDYTRSLHDRIRQLEETCSSLRQALGQKPTPPAVMGSDQSKTPSAAIHEQVNCNEAAGGVTAMGAMLSEDILTGASSGSQDFYGGSSAVSFLKEAIGQQTPRASTATNAEQQRRMALSYSSLQKFPLPPRVVADHLVQRYFERIYYLYPFFDRETFEKSYQYLWQPEIEASMSDDRQHHDLGLGSSPGGDFTSIVFHCALNAIFALGCTFSDLATSEKPAAIELFFSRSKSHVSIDLLDMNNVGVVQTLLLVALVLQGTPFPSRCWNAVGVACRAAQGLGLHADALYQQGESREREIRRRTWHGCIIMDIFVSMTFGRPNMATTLPTLSAGGITCDAPLSNLEPNELKLLFNMENVRLSKILEGILSKIYRPWLHRSTTGEESVVLDSDMHHSLDDVVAIDTQLSKFEKTVPPSLSWLSPTSFDSLSPEDRLVLTTQRNVLHARFLYLQIILHRPTLTHLASKDTASRSATLSGDAGSDVLKNGLKSSFALESGKLCSRAAMKLAELIYNTHQSETSDAWWWNGLYACTSGLVLIVARITSPLCNCLVESEVDKSWSQCQAVLQNLASFSDLCRKSTELLLKVNEILLARKAAKDLGSDVPPEGVEEGQQTPFLNGQGLPVETSDLGLSFGLDVQGTSEMGIIGSFFSSWDQGFDLMPTDLYDR